MKARFVEFYCIAILYAFQDLSYGSKQLKVKSNVLGLHCFLLIKIDCGCTRMEHGRELYIT